MMKTVSASEAKLFYTTTDLGREKADADLRRIWPEFEKLYDGENPELFKKFSRLVYRSFADSFLADRTARQRYHQLKHYFDFFMSDLEPMAGNGDLPGALVRVVDTPEESLPEGERVMASTEIMIHVIDSPFIFENLLGYLNLAEHHVLSAIHPVVTVRREQGRVVDILPPEEDGQKEVAINFQIRKVVSPDTMQKLETEILSILNALFLSVTDFQKMSEETRRLCDELYKDKSDPEDASETAEFLSWLVPNNFIFMGMISFDVENSGGGYRLKEKKGSCYGVYRNRKLMEAVYPGLSEEIEKRTVNTFDRKFMMMFDFLTNSSSIIYHRQAVDAVIVRRYGKDRVPISVTMLLGRLARSAETSRASDVPFLRKKFQRLIVSGKIRPNSYLYREFISGFNYMPKKELFYIDRRTLSAVLNISASLQGDDEVQLLVRHNPDFEYLTVILLFSAKKYSVENINIIKEYLDRIFDLEMVYAEAVQSATVTQVFVYFKAEGGVPADMDIGKISDEIRELLTTWDQLMVNRLVSMLGDQAGFALFNRFRKRLTDLYRQAVKPEEAASDLRMLERVDDTQTLQLAIDCTSPTTATLKIYWDRELDLMKLIPTFRNLGLYVKEEIALPLEKVHGKSLYIQLLNLEDSEEGIKRLESSRSKLTEAIQLIIGGKIEDCPLNRLVLLAGFDWNQVDLVRGYKNYFLQINKSVNPNSVNETINKYPALLALTVRFFEEKFDPQRGDGKKMEKIEAEFEKGLGDITDLTEDNILRILFNIVENTLRTNYFKPRTEYYTSFKFNCAGIMQMPKPVPMAEIYVHTPFLEGVHLRGGKVARGGLRWSDRPDDFRTEILGLMKTQMVKNSVIVPVGSKGGFILKKMKFKTATDREAAFKRNYQIFIRGLLDITDNMIEGKSKRPESITCMDGPDPYLVVAADKGTAKMSDAANEVAKDYGFWLGDAFASGGAVGYDHKKYGITARGAWECVKRHFRELGTDIQNESITVAGIGDMGGDVFGNGMLLSRKIKLVTAFNHMHIFLDPDPDPEKSYLERERLFKKSGSSWMDYDKEVISKGGGVYFRFAKSIPISKKMQKLLKENRDSMSGQELVKAILTMPVDLLYCGGIGTYIRASDETNLEVSDKTNDPVRVPANKLRTRVVGEGANLAFTQRARIEYARHGGILNTDAVDNSGGVDMSDHEVNLKILLEILLSRNEMKDVKERNEFFMKAGPEVAEHVLQDNYLQSAGISLDQKRSERKTELFFDYVDESAAKGRLDRVDEEIPEREELLSYTEKPGYMPRPILAVLLSYEKMRLYQELLDSPIVELAFSNRYFYGYFPKTVSRDFAASLNLHSLKKEIIATVISNRVVNQAGATFVYAVERAVGCLPWEVVRAYMIVENLLQADEFRKMVHSLDNTISAMDQNDYLLRMEDVIAREVLWMLKHMPAERISFDFIIQYQEVINRFRENLISRLETICSLETGCIDDKVRKLAKGKVPRELGEWIVLLPYLKDVMSIVTIKEEKHANFIETGNLFIQVTNTFEIDWISNVLENYVPETTWEKSALENMTRELETHQSKLVLNVLGFKRKGENPEVAFRNYMLEKEREMKSYREIVSKIKEEKSNDLLALGVLVRRIADFV
jgi:glutamate dehydrogenase